jgi:hypothetical protein
MAQATTHEPGSKTDFQVSKEASYHRFVRGAVVGALSIAVLLLLLAAFLL